MTPQQNRAFHLWCRWIAEALQEIGYDMREVRLPIRPTPENVKELCREVMRAADPSKTSSTQYTTTDLDLIVDAMSRGLAEHELHVPFPTEADLCDSVDP